MVVRARRAARTRTPRKLVAAGVGGLLLGTPAWAQEPLGEPDLTILLALRDEYGWGPAFGWTSGNPCPASGSPWNGVSCFNDRVDFIVADCVQFKLAQPLPLIIGQLTAMRDFSLRGCDMIGDPPTVPSNRLTRLRVDNNTFSGFIPGGTTQLSNLLTLNLSANLLTGPIPPMRNVCTAIVRLTDNYLTSIPECWTAFNRDVSRNCYESTDCVPTTCNPAPPGSNVCGPNRADCPPPMSLFEVTTLSDTVDSDPFETSLREAIAAANAYALPVVITFHPSLAGGTILLSQGWENAADDSALKISGHIIISAPPDGITLAVVNQPRRHLRVEDGATLHLHNLMLSGGNVTT